MPGIPFAAGNPGRPPGSINKTTREVKAALAEAFDGLGGVEALVRWGQANPNLFYPLWAKLLPHQVTGEGGGPVVLSIVTGITASPESA